MESRSKVWFLHQGFSSAESDLGPWPVKTHACPKDGNSTEASEEAGGKGSMGRRGYIGKENSCLRKTFRTEQKEFRTLSASGLSWRLIDRFGPVPSETEELLRIVPLRRLAARLGAEKVFLKGGRMSLFFISNPESPYYQSQAFGKVIAYMEFLLVAAICANRILVVVLR